MIDLNKRYKTRDGRAVVLHSINKLGAYPVLGDVYYAKIGWVSRKWTADGYYTGRGCYHFLNLVEIKPLIDWSNIRQKATAIVRRLVWWK